MSVLFAVSCIPRTENGIEPSRETYYRATARILSHATARTFFVQPYTKPRLSDGDFSQDEHSYECGGAEVGDAYCTPRLPQASISSTHIIWVGVAHLGPFATSSSQLHPSESEGEVIQRCFTNNDEITTHLRIRNGSGVLAGCAWPSIIENRWLARSGRRRCPPLRLICCWPCQLTSTRTEDLQSKQILSLYLFTRNGNV